MPYLSPTRCFSARPSERWDILFFFIFPSLSSFLFVCLFRGGDVMSFTGLWCMKKVSPLLWDRLWADWSLTLFFFFSFLWEEQRGEKASQCSRSIFFFFFLFTICVNNAVTHDVSWYKQRTNTSFLFHPFFASFFFFFTSSKNTFPPSFFFSWLTCYPAI